MITDSDDLWPLVLRLRETKPLVQCITNFVSMDVAANVLLAIGASPAMVHDAEEAGEFVGLGGTLSVNIGTPSPRWVESMIAAASAAHARGTPWVLDPVAIGATSYRSRIVEALMPFAPTVIRGNAGEIMAMAGDAEVEVTGPDSSRASSDAHAAARALARRERCTVVVTGAEDIVTDGARTTILGNGHPLMTKVTALGCSLTAVTAAFLGVCDDAQRAATAAVAYFGVCGEIAAEGAPGPGTLRVRLLDILYGLDRDSFLSRIRISHES